MNVVRSDEDLEGVSKVAACITPRTVHCNRGGSNVVTSSADEAKRPITQTSPKNISSPKRRSAEDTYFDRDMCRFCWGQDYIQDDVTGLDQEVSGQFFDVLDKLRRINMNFNSKRYSRKHYRWISPTIAISRSGSPNLRKLADITQAENHKTRAAIDQAICEYTNCYYLQIQHLKYKISLEVIL